MGHSTVQEVHNGHAAAEIKAKNGNGVSKPAEATANAGAEVLGQEFTKLVIGSMGPGTNPRLRTIMASFIQHIHDFAREVDLTFDEWLMGVNMINKAGQISSDIRNEGQLMCDVIGLESLVDNITYLQAAKSNLPITSSAILGPFYRTDTPFRDNGSSIILNMPSDGEVTLMHGRVTSAATGEALSNAIVDVWQASTNGYYEQQDPAQTEFNLRGKFRTDSDGRYSFYCLRPTPYPVPSDGPAGKLLDLLDRHHWRPAHIHLIVEAKGHKPVTTQIFDSKCKYLENDAVFAVKDDLALDFKPVSGDPKRTLDLPYDISLAATD